MRLAKTASSSLLLLVLCGVLLAPAPVSGQASPCPPGQPSGRPPGTPPDQPGQPDGRPPAYPPGQCSLRLSTAAAQRGQTFQATANGYAAGEVVQFSIGGVDVATATADSQGVANASLTVPAGLAAGRTEVVAAGASQRLTAALEVLAAAAGAGAAGEVSRSLPAPAGSGLARTGTYIAGATVAGLLLLGVGFALATGARRRRRSSTMA